MPLIRYRTGDIASLDHSLCRCGGVTARLENIRGRLAGSRLAGGLLLSQDLDDLLFQISGLLDYRITLDRMGTDRLFVDFVATSAMTGIKEEIRRLLLQVPAIHDSLADNERIIGMIQRVAGFAANHTVKRTILDQRSTGEQNAAHT